MSQWWRSISSARSSSRLATSLRDQRRVARTWSTATSRRAIISCCGRRGSSSTGSPPAGLVIAGPPRLAQKWNQDRDESNGNAEHRGLRIGRRPPILFVVGQGKSAADIASRADTTRAPLGGWCESVHGARRGDSRGGLEPAAPAQTGLGQTVGAAVTATGRRTERRCLRGSRCRTRCGRSRCRSRCRRRRCRRPGWWPAAGPVAAHCAG